jgi:hypothetical protein
MNYNPEKDARARFDALYSDGTVGDFKTLKHEVRGHWRNDWRNPPSKHCNPHIWKTVDDNADLIVCKLCHGRRFYIHKHKRGDASLSYVTHRPNETRERQ